jgi:hypothetical protein
MLRYLLISLPLRFCDLKFSRVRRGTFNEDPPRVGVARFGDCSLATFVAVGRFIGNQPKISHKLVGMIEALESAEFGNRDHLPPGVGGL